MSIRIHIERLVLTAPAMTRAQERQLRASLAEELRRLVQQGRLSPQILTAGRLHSMSVRSSPHAGANSPADIGKQVANAVYDTVGSHDQQPSRTHETSTQLRASGRSGG
jgi:hypothetical protein